MALLSACYPTKGSDPNAFVQAPTTNTDFQMPGTEIPVGLEPTSAAIAPRGTGCPASDPNFLAPNAAVANFGGNTVTFLGNDGTGQLTPQTVGVGFGPAVVQFADLDGSNQTNCSFDIVVLLAQNATGIGNGVTVLLTSDNAHWTAQTLSFGVTPAQVHVADMNGDGFQDIVASLPGSSGIAILLNDGPSSPGHFSTAPVLVPLGAPPGRFIVADYLGNPLDLDGDGCTDMVALIPGSNRIDVIVSNNGGTACAGFTGTYTVAPYLTEAGPVEIAAGDVDGDLHPEVMVLTASRSYLHIFKNSAVFPATFTTYPGTPILLRAAPYRMALAQFAGTHLGIATVHPNDKSGGVVQWNGSGFVSSVFPVRETPFDVAAGIFTTSTLLDLVIPESLKRIVYIAHGDGLGAFNFTQIGLLHIPGSPALGRLRPGPGETHGGFASATVPNDALVTEKNDNTVLYLMNRN